MSSWSSLRHLQRVSRDTSLSNQFLCGGEPNVLLSSNKATDLFKQAVEVHMNAVSTRGIKQDILTMTITQTKDMTHHTHNRWSTTVCQTAHIPVKAQTSQDEAGSDLWSPKGAGRRGAWCQAFHASRVETGDKNATACFILWLLFVNNAIYTEYSVLK